MTKYLVVITSLFFIIGLTSFQSSNNDIKNFNNFNLIQTVDAEDVISLNNKRPMSVKKYVKGKDVYVECVISDFTFSEKGDQNNVKNKYGFLQLYLNGKKIDNIYTAAFIIKGLPVGSHQIKLVLVGNDGTPYGIEHNFEVDIT